MHHMLLIYDSENALGSLSEGESEQMLKDYGAFTQELIDRGALVSANRLRPTGTATTVRVRDGETLSTDGPFAETKEQLGGYYLIEARDLDEAMAIAAKIPSARLGSIEVRPIQKFD